MSTAVPLTSLSHGAGCGCKLPAAALAPLVLPLSTGLPAAGLPHWPAVIKGRVPLEILALVLALCHRVVSCVAWAAGPR